MPHTLTHSQTTEYRATQLVSSIKHKLSHAIVEKLIPTIRNLFYMTRMFSAKFYLVLTSFKKI